MSITWLRNHYGGTLTDAEFEDIPRPNLELNVHVTLKTFQAGCFLGTVIAGATSLIAGPRTMPGFLSRVNRYGLRGAIIGLALGPMMTYAKTRNLEEPAIKDRCYRIRHNRGQVRVDQGVDAGFVLGPAVAYAMGGSLVTGMVLGVSTGVVTMAVVNKQLKSKQ